MAPSGRARTVLLAIFVIASAIWVGWYSPWAVLREARVKAAEAENQVLRRYADERRKREEMEQAANRRPEIAEKPPFPTAAIDAAEFDMGTILVDQSTGHTFKIRNIGQAPLVLVWYPGGCKVPLPPFPRYQEIAPGRSIDIELTWTPHEATRFLEKVARFWTNDPGRPQLDLKICGTAK